jgi:hypothetical protein
MYFIFDFILFYKNHQVFFLVFFLFQWQIIFHFLIFWNLLILDRDLLPIKYFLTLKNNHFLKRKVLQQYNLLWNNFDPTKSFIKHLSMIMNKDFHFCLLKIDACHLLICLAIKLLYHCFKEIIFLVRLCSI